ncbi:MAG: hypothetical protein ABW252_10295 [Polyangiales bacterium]
MTKASRPWIGLGLGLAVACGDAGDAARAPELPTNGADGVAAQPDASADRPTDAGTVGADDWMNGGEDTPEYSLGRLLVARGDAPELVLLDLDTASVAGRLPYVQGARVYAGPGGRYGYAVDTAGGSVRIVEPGQWLLSHIDHFHVMRDTHALRPEQLDHGGALAAHDGWVTVVDRGTGRASLFQERSVTAQQFRPAETALGPGATAGIVAHAQLLAVTQTAEGSWISQRPAVNPGEEATRTAPCERPGEVAAREGAVYFACDAGLITLTFSEASRALVAEPVRAGFDARPTRVRVTPRFDGAVADAGPRMLVIVRTGMPPLHVPFARAVLDFAVHRAGQVVIALTADGVVHEVTLRDGATARRVEVIAPQAEPADLYGAARIALSHAYAYVADPRRRDVPALRLRSFAVEQQLPVDGAPADLTVVGMPPQYTDARE